MSQREAFVYVVTNLTNGHKYVGKSIHPHRRWRRHCRDAMKGSTLTFHRAIMTYGCANFDLTIVQSFIDEPSAFAFEMALCEQLSDAGERLYNETSGGLGGSSPTLEVRQKISRRVKESLSKVDMTIVRASPEYKRSLSRAVGSSYTAELRTIRSERCSEQWRSNRDLMCESMRTTEARRRRSLAHLGSKRSNVVVVPADVQSVKAQLSSLGNSPRQVADAWNISYYAVKCIANDDSRQFVVPVIEILGLHAQGVDLRTIATSCGVRPSTVNRVIDGRLALSTKSCAHGAWRAMRGKIDHDCSQTSSAF